MIWVVFVRSSKVFLCCSRVFRGICFALARLHFWDIFPPLPQRTLQETLRRPSRNGFFCASQPPSDHRTEVVDSRSDFFFSPPPGLLQRQFSFQAPRNFSNGNFVFPFSSVKSCGRQVLFLLVAEGHFRGFKGNHSRLHLRFPPSPPSPSSSPPSAPPQGTLEAPSREASRVTLQG